LSLVSSEYLCSSSSMLADGSAVLVTCEVFFLVNIVVRVLGIPVGVAHLIFFQQVFLRTPHVFRAMRVFGTGVWPLVLGNEDLIISHEIVNTRVHLVLKPGVRDTQIVIGMNTDGKLSGNRIPRVLVHFPDGSVSVNHLSHFIISRRRPEDFNLFSLGVGYNLTTAVSLVRFIKDIDSEVHDHVSEINLFVRGQTQLLNAECFTTGKAGNATHNFFNICALSSVIPRSAHLSVGFFDIFHCKWSIIGRNRSRLSNWVDVTHIVNWWWRIAMERLNVGVDVLS